MSGISQTRLISAIARGYHQALEGGGKAMKTKIDFIINEKLRLHERYSIKIILRNHDENFNVHRKPTTNPLRIWILVLLAFPYISEQIDKRLQNVFRRENAQDRLTRRNKKLIDALKRPPIWNECQLKSRPNNIRHRKCIINKITCTGNTQSQPILRRQHSKSTSAEAWPSISPRRQEFSNTSSKYPHRARHVGTFLNRYSSWAAVRKKRSIICSGQQLASPLSTFLFEDFLRQKRKPNLAASKLLLGTSYLWKCNCRFPLPLEGCIVLKGRSEAQIFLYFWQLYRQSHGSFR